MADLDPDAVIERRRLRRRLGFWRIVAIAAVLGTVGAAVWRAVPTGPYVARFDVTGAIFDDPERDATLRELARDEDVRAVMLRINSPGGSVAGSEALHEALRAVAEAKPLVAVLGEVAASGGYIAAIAADHIVARGGTVTGSIGVIAEFPNVEGLLDTLGVDVARVASAPLKAEPSPFREPSAAALAAQRSLIEDSYDWFLSLVAARRGLAPEDARRLGDGRVYTGRQAAAEGLIDAVGGESVARDWLETARGVPPSLPLRDVEIDREDDGLLGPLGGAALGLRLRKAAAELGAGPALMAIQR